MEDRDGVSGCFHITEEMIQTTRWQKMEEVSPRVKALRENLLKTQPEISVDRAVLITETYRETTAQSPVLRRARALGKSLRVSGSISRRGSSS
ncbi:MAG TPA: hypothetical protein VMX75_10235 [Spirochaetia bacterium]|nr:hypothetical protein [Spirochaetia bacterium]